MDTSLHFIQSATLLIEELYPSTNSTIEIETTSCRLAGQLMCTYLMKMLFAFYDTEPMSEEQLEISKELQSGRIICTIELKLFLSQSHPPQKRFEDGYYKNLNYSS